MLSSSLKRRLSGAVFALAIFTATGAFAFPTARTATRMVYNEENQRVLLFGGISPLDSGATRRAFGDTWEWNGRIWVQLHPDVAPSKRFGHAFVYDTLNDRALLFGGGEGTQDYDDTWQYKGGAWTLLSPPNAPSPRRFPAATWDRLRNRVLLFGGNHAVGETTTNYFDTWAFNGTTWTRLHENGPQLTGASIVVDEKNDQILLLGAKTDGTVEMHRFNETGWEKLSPTTLPLCVRESALVYQRHNERVVQVGGGCENGNILETTYEWDGTNFQKIDTSSTNPGTVFGMAYTYDEARQETLLFGGSDFGGERSLTYGYRDARWKTRGDLVYPGPRSLMVLERDPKRNVLYLFGGQNERIDFFDLWKYEQGRWATVTAPDAPAICRLPLGSWDTDRDRMVVLCFDGSTFEFDGDKWYRFANLNDKPPSRSFSSFVYDAKNKRSVMFGGYDGITYLRDTWTWNGTRWTRLDRKDAPPSRILGTLFYDPVQSKVMLFGGIGRPAREDRIERYGDMWSLDGSTWTELKPATQPSPRYGALSEIDPVTNTAMMFGGKNQLEQYVNEQWRWDGTNWIRVEPGTLPSERMNGGFSIDPVTQRLAYYGGYAGAYFSDYWILTDQGWRVVPQRTGRTRATGVARPSRGSAGMPRGE